MLVVNKNAPVIWFHSQSSQQPLGCQPVFPGKNWPGLGTAATSPDRMLGLPEGPAAFLLSGAADTCLNSLRLRMTLSTHMPA